MCGMAKKRKQLWLWLDGKKWSANINYYVIKGVNTESLRRHNRQEPQKLLVNTNSLKEQSKRLLSIETPISSLTIKNNNLNINCHPPIQSDMEQYLKFFWNRGTVIKNLIMFNFSIWKMQIPAPVLSTMSKHIDFVNWRVSSSYIVLK